MLQSTGAGKAGDIAATILDANLLLQRASMTYDGATIRKLIPDDFTLITSSGRMMSASDLIREVEDRSFIWSKNDTSDAKVRVYNDDCAIITAILHQRYEQGGKLNDYRVYFTDTWVLRDGAWLYVAGHASRLPSG
jgi:hypothetical protein